MSLFPQKALMFLLIKFPNYSSKAGNINHILKDTISSTMLKEMKNLKHTDVACLLQGH